MANKTTITAEPGKQEIFITREFDTPRKLVFKAHTDPELYVQWLGPRELTMILETFVFQSVADRDGMLRSGMERGVNDGYDRLDEILAKGSTD